MRILVAITIMSLAPPAIAADKSTKPRIAVIEFGDTEASSDKPRLAVLEFGDTEASSDKPRIAVLEFGNARDLSLARDGKAAVTLVDRTGVFQCSFDGGALTDADGTPLLTVVHSLVYAPGVAAPIYAYGDDLLTDAAGTQTVLVSEDGAPLGALELAVAIANRDGYCR